MNAESEKRKVVLTCAQPTGKLHLGNYLGAVKNWVEMAEKYECYFGVVDMHAITIPYVPAELKKNVYDCAAQYMACGLDPEKCNLFLQSSIVGHAELLGFGLHLPNRTARENDAIQRQGGKA